MSVRVDIITDESCDHCEAHTSEMLVRFRYRCVETGPIQLWLHPSCLAKLTTKAEKMLQAVSNA